MRRTFAWAPSVMMAMGILATLGVRAQRSMPLRTPLTTAVPGTIAGLAGADVALRDDVVRVAGVTSYLMRSYGGAPADSSLPVFSLYVGYYDRQARGKTIHSPKNCLPGAGWEPLQSVRVTIPTENGPIPVNRYVLQNGTRRVLVLYWYQGRGRTAADEYAVKWHLLRDAALRQRSEEALVRVVVPIDGAAEPAFDLASRVAAVVAPALTHALPG